PDGSAARPQREVLAALERDVRADRDADVQAARAPRRAAAPLRGARPSSAPDGRLVGAEDERARERRRADRLGRPAPRVAHADRRSDGARADLRLRGPDDVATWP